MHCRLKLVFVYLPSIHSSIKMHFICRAYRPSVLVAGTYNVLYSLQFLSLYFCMISCAYRFKMTWNLSHCYICRIHNLEIPSH